MVATGCGCATDDAGAAPARETGVLPENLVRAASIELPRLGPIGCVFAAVLLLSQAAQAATVKWCGENGFHPAHPRLLGSLHSQTRLSKPVRSPVIATR